MRMEIHEELPRVDVRVGGVVALAGDVRGPAALQRANDRV
jgi:hypothetical protein